MMPAMDSRTVIIGRTLTSVIIGAFPNPFGTTFSRIGRSTAIAPRAPAQIDCDTIFLRNEPLIGVRRGSSESKKPPVPITAASSIYMFSIENHI